MLSLVTNETLQNMGECLVLKSQKHYGWGPSLTKSHPLANGSIESPFNQLPSTHAKSQNQSMKFHVYKFDNAKGVMLLPKQVLVNISVSMVISCMSLAPTPLCEPKYLV